MFPGLFSEGLKAITFLLCFQSCKVENCLILLFSLLSSLSVERVMVSPLPSLEAYRKLARSFAPFRICLSKSFQGHILGFSVCFSLNWGISENSQCIFPQLCLVPLVILVSHTVMPYHTRILASCFLDICGKILDSIFDLFVCVFICACLLVFSTFSLHFGHGEMEHL